MDKNLIIGRIENAYNYYDSEYDYRPNTNSIEKVLDVCYNAKSQLRRKLEVLDGWDEELQRVKLDFPMQRDFDKDKARSIIDMIAEKFYYSNKRVDARTRNQRDSMIQDAKYRIVGAVSGELLVNYVNSICGTNHSDKKATIKVIRAFVEYMFETSGCFDKDLFGEESVKILKGYIDRQIEDLSIALSVKTWVETAYVSIALNDYLTMSYGNSWNSCHWLGGCCENGAVSYALDEVTMIVYNEDDNNRKIWRQCYYLNDSHIYAGRLYGGVKHDITDKVFDKLCDMLQLDDSWVEYDNGLFQKRVNEAYGSAHYPDYNYERDYGRYKSCDTSKYITIGHIGICLGCGEENSTSDSVVCQNCMGVAVCGECGSIHDKDDMYEIDVRYYCNNCAMVCEDCDDVVLRCDAEYLYKYDKCVCTDCLNEYYYKCDDCEEYIHGDYVYTDNNGAVFCKDCAENYCVCANCGELIKFEDSIDYKNETYCEYCYNHLDKEEENEEENEHIV